MADNTLSNMVLNVTLEDPHTMQRHLRFNDPHPQYIMVDNLASVTKSRLCLEHLHNVSVDPDNTLVNHVLAFNGSTWEAIDVNLIVQAPEASYSRSGTVILAAKDMIAAGINGSYAPTPKSVKDYCTETFSVLGHTHKYADITEKPIMVETITNSNRYSKNSIVTPNALAAYSLVGHQHQTSDIVGFDTIIEGHTHTIPQVEDLEDALVEKAEADHKHLMRDILDYVAPPQSKFQLLYKLIGSGPFPVDENDTLPGEARDFPKGYFEIPAKASGSNSDDLIVVQWGTIYTGTASETTRTVSNLPYANIDTVLYLGFNPINRGGISAHDYTAQIVSIVRNNATHLVTGFNYIIQLFGGSVNIPIYISWIMVGLKRKESQVDQTGTSIVLNMRRSKQTAAFYDGSEMKTKLTPIQLINETIPHLSNVTSTKSMYFGLTSVTRDRLKGDGYPTGITHVECDVIPQIISYNEPVSTSGNLQCISQAVASNYSNVAIEWIRLAINKRRTALSDVTITGDWSPFNQYWTSFDIGNCHDLTIEIPINTNPNNSVQLYDSYMKIPVKIKGQNKYGYLVISWGTGAAQKQEAFTQALPAEYDELHFVQMVGYGNLISNDQASDWDFNWYLSEKSSNSFTGYKNYTQSITKVLSSYEWLAIGFENTNDTLTTQNEYDQITKLFKIQLNANKTLVIQTGNVASTSQHSSSTLYDTITVNAKLTKVLYTAFTILNSNQKANKEFTIHRYVKFNLNAGNEYTDYAALSSTTNIYYRTDKIRNYKDAATSVSFDWAVVGLIES